MMIPRGTPDIGWVDLGSGLLDCLRVTFSSQAVFQADQNQAEQAWSKNSQNPQSLACLSVRSGLDLVLQALALPPGSEVLVSAITIPDMIHILEHHQLIPIPIDLDMATLSVKLDHLTQAIRPQTRAILIAHLFGSRMPLDPIVSLARQHGLYLLEDCAQAYAGTAYSGHPASDVSFFSFGPIKTQTALGGAILKFRDLELLENVRSRQSNYPLQSWQAFAKRLSFFLFLKILALPPVFTLFVAACRGLGVNHDQILSDSLRGFPSGNLIQHIRYRPCQPLLRLLARRLQASNPQEIDRRTVRGQKLDCCLPLTQRPGARANPHTHWVLPMQTAASTELLRRLWAAGFDATKSASRLYVVQPPADRPEQRPGEALEVMSQVIYLPQHPWMGDQEIQHLGQVITEFEQSQAKTTNPSSVLRSCA